MIISTTATPETFFHGRDRDWLETSDRSAAVTRLLLLSLAVVGVCEILRRLCLAIWLWTNRFRPISSSRHDEASATSTVAPDSLQSFDDDATEVPVHETEFLPSVISVMCHLQAALAEMEELKAKLLLAEAMPAASESTCRPAETQLTPSSCSPTVIQHLTPLSLPPRQLPTQREFSGLTETKKTEPDIDSGEEILSGNHSPNDVTSEVKPQELVNDAVEESGVKFQFAKREMTTGERASDDESSTQVQVTELPQESMQKSAAGNTSTADHNHSIAPSSPSTPSTPPGSAEFTMATAAAAPAAVSAHPLTSVKAQQHVHMPATRLKLPAALRRRNAAADELVHSHTQDVAKLNNLSAAVTADKSRNGTHDSS